jgi:hypothetical protein
LNRDDVACASVVDSVATVAADLCVPACASDAGCGSGLHCDYGTGLCTTHVPTGRPFGAACDPLAVHSQCASNSCGCVDPQCSTGFCTGRCEMGTANPGCGDDGRAVCALVSSHESGGRGDSALCEQLCDSDGDCDNPSFVCNALPAAEQQSSGRKGVCFTAFAKAHPS